MPTQSVSRTEKQSDRNSQTETVRQSAVSCSSGHEAPVSVISSLCSTHITLSYLDVNAVCVNWCTFCDDDDDNGDDGSEG